MKKLTIVHSYPISFFPPAMNLAEMVKDKIDVEIITKKPDKGQLDFNADGVRLYALKSDTNSRWSRFMGMVWFELFTLIRLIGRHPDAILCYESASVYATYLYKRYLKRKVEVYIHYHEYMTQDEYDRLGMRSSARNHRKEKEWLYEHAKWVSHTNQQRMDFFLEDCPMIPKTAAHIFPNYPPKSWWKKEKHHGSDVVRCVYVGSLSLKDTFVHEFCEWICRQNGKVIFDIYSFNFHKDTLEDVENMDCPYIHFHNEGVKYMDIPQLLERYDVGVLLYKATSINFKWNETNKFYEYLICGLDVWYPKEMLLLHDIDKSIFAPAIKEMDFSHIDNFDGTIRCGCVDNSGFDRFADDVYLNFAEKLNNE